MRHAAAIAVAGGVMLAGSLVGWATSGSDMAQPPSVSAEFQKIRALAGTWKGTTVEPDGKEQPAVVEYLVTSGGSAVVETLFPGTDHAMVSVYHDHKGKLAMTHYCMLGNQPQLALTSETPDRMELSLAPDSGIDASTETHMHALTLAWADADHVKQTWTLFEHGKATGATTITLAREK